MEKQVLTRKETEVLKLVLKELTSAEIAERLKISIRTVDTHRKHIGQKLGSTHMMAYIKYALQHQIHI